MSSSGREAYVCSRAWGRLSIWASAGSCGGLHRRPCDVLLVQLAVAQAAVENADQPVGKYPQRFLVSLLPGTLKVVVASGSRRGREGGEGPPLAGIGQPVVANEPGQHHLGPARGLGDGRGAGVVFACPTIVVAVRIISELGEYPGAEDWSKSWQTEVDLGVRVRFQRAVEFLLLVVDPGPDGSDEAGQVGHGHAAGLGHHGRLLQLGSTQRVADRDRPFLGVVTARLTESAGDLGQRQRPALGGSRGPLQQGQRIRLAEVFTERLQCPGIELAKGAPKLVAELLTGPDQALVGARQDLDRLGQLGVL